MVEVPCNGETPGSLLVPAETLARAIGKCDYDVDVSFKDNHLYIKNGEQEYKLLTMREDAAFPFREKKDFSHATLELSQLNESMKIILPASDTVRENEFKGIGFTSENGKLRLSSMSATSAGGYSALIDCRAGEFHSCIIERDLADSILALPSKDDMTLSIGFDKASIAIKFVNGYFYFPQLVGMPFDISKYAPLWKLETKPCHVSAGLLAKAISSVMVMADNEDGRRGRILGGNGCIQVYSHSNQCGAAKNKVIIAGDLDCDNWYNFHTLNRYLTAIPPDEEIKVHAAHSENRETAILIVQYKHHVFWLANCFEPDGAKTNDAKKSRKDIR